MIPERGLTEQEKSLAHRYLVTNDAKQSALDVGYSESCLLYTSDAADDSTEV